MKDPTPQQRSVLEEVVALADQVVVMSESARERLCALRRRPPQDHHHPARRGAAQDRGPEAFGPADHPDVGFDRSRQGHRAGHRRDGLAEGPSAPAALPDRRPHPSEGARRPGRGLSRIAHRAGTPPRGRQFGVLRRRLPQPRSADRDDAGRLGRGPALRLEGPGHLRCARRLGRQRAACRRDRLPARGRATRQRRGHRDRSRRSRCTGGALRQLLTDPRVAGSMASEARDLAPALAWPVVANAYVSLAQRLVAARLAAA